MFAYKDNNDFYFFIFYVFPAMVIFSNLFGNILALIMLQRKNLRKIGPLLMHKFLFISDLTYSIPTFITYLVMGFGIGLFNHSMLACKIYFYFNHTLTSFSAEAIIYIAVDRLISIKFPTRRLLLKNKKIQFGSILGFVLFNLVYEVPALFNYGTKTINNNTKLCASVDPTMKLVVLYMDLTYRVIILSLLMLVVSILIIYIIFKSRSRIRSSTNRENEKFNKDSRLAVTSLVINLVYFILNSQFTLCSFFSSSIPSYVYSFSFNVFYLSYASNFYIMVASNKLFRREFLSFFKIIKFKRKFFPKSNTNSNQKSTM